MAKNRLNQGFVTRGVIPEYSLVGASQSSALSAKAVRRRGVVGKKIVRVLEQQRPKGFSRERAVEETWLNVLRIEAEVAWQRLRARRFPRRRRSGTRPGERLGPRGAGIPGDPLGMVARKRT
jgi:hypothetical protein